MSWVWNVVGLFVGLVGAAGAGLDQFIWANSASLDIFPNVRAKTRWGLDVPRPLYNVRHWVYWTLILFGVLLQFVDLLR